MDEHDLQWLFGEEPFALVGYQPAGELVEEVQWDGPGGSGLIATRLYRDGKRFHLDTWRRRPNGLKELNVEEGEGDGGEAMARQKALVASLGATLR